jgi:hypothetical protein
MEIDMGGSGGDVIHGAYGHVQRFENTQFNGGIHAPVPAFWQQFETLFNGRTDDVA